MDPQIGDIFDGRYRLNALLGRGGFAVVFDAVDVTSGRRVALKILTPDRDNDYAHATRTRFRREVEVAASLRSPHTVTMYHHDVSSGGLLYIAFEYLGGEDLAEILAREGRLQPAESIEILRQVLESLEEAHRAGLLHRDVKPENIRVVRRDTLQVKLMDFGIARATESGSPSVTVTGEVVGTPRYMSPEQLRGQPLTPASDMYSAGVVAFEMLCGREGMHGYGWLDQMDRLLDTTSFELPAELGLPAWLTKWVQRMTDVNPARRPSARAALHALSARRDSTGDRSVESATPRPNLALVVGVVAGLLAAFGFALYQMSREPSQAPVVRRSNAGALLRQEAPADIGRPPASDVGRDPAADLAVVVDPTTGCGQPATFEGEGVLGTRLSEWLTYLPADYDANHRHPLVILLHEGAQSPGELLRGSGFTDVADRERVVVVAPKDDNEALFKTWSSPTSALDLITAVVEGTATQLCIDRSRVFIAGQGEGGHAALALSCEPWIRAIATNSYLFFVNQMTVCETTHPTPHLFLAAKKSQVTPFDGGPSCIPGREKVSAHQMREFLGARHGCKGDAEVVRDKDGGTCRRWDCEVPFEACWTKGGQGWPGTRREGIAGACDGDPPDFPTSEVVWEFFARSPPRAD